MYVNCNNLTYFHSFAIECSPKGIMKFKSDKNEWIIRGYFCFEFVHFMLNNKRIGD